MKHYICQGCLFFNETSYLKYSQYFHCVNCEKRKSDIYNQIVSDTFKYHNKSGYKCLCGRFIPKSNKEQIYCPYPDCDFIGDSKLLKNMKYPYQDINFSIDNTKKSSLKEIISSQKTLVSFNSFNYTVIHKISILEAFEQILDSNPNELIDYLINSTYSGMLNKIFKSYITIIENKMPFQVKKNRKIITISNITDNNLNIFDGISVFKSKITDKLEIHNETNELYIGGRSGFHSKPYYIGKLLNIVNLDDNSSILNDVDNYSFSKIKLKQGTPNSEVEITHLRVAPHYQMGAMSAINRIRKSLSDHLK